MLVKQMHEKHVAQPLNDFVQVSVWIQAAQMLSELYRGAQKLGQLLRCYWPSFTVWCLFQQLWCVHMCDQTFNLTGLRPKPDCILPQAWNAGGHVHVSEDTSSNVLLADICQAYLTFVVLQNLF